MYLDSDDENDGKILLGPLASTHFFPMLLDLKPQAYV